MAKETLAHEMPEVLEAFNAFYASGKIVKEKLDALHHVVQGDITEGNMVFLLGEFNTIVDIVNKVQEMLSHLPLIWDVPPMPKDEFQKLKKRELGE